jgi:hypothetical protein
MKVARWKVHFLLRICEKDHVHHSSEHMAHYSSYAIRRKAVVLESRSYNKSHPSPKDYCFSKIDDQKPFFIVRILA